MKASKRSALLAVVLGVILTLGGASATWFSAAVPAVVATDDVAVTGSAAAPVLGALVLVSAAAVVAQLLARGVVARAMGIVVALAGAGAVVATVMALGDRTSIMERAASTATGVPTLAGSIESTPWPYAALAGGLVLCVGGVLLSLVKPRSTNSQGDRYARTPSPQARASADATPIDDWDALSQGHDPSAPRP